MKHMTKLLIAVIAAVFILGISLFAAVCVCAARPRNAVPSDCIIVLGARVWPDGRMSTTLENRCEAALKAWQDGIARNIIVCGTQGDDEPAPEGDVMRAWFIENGVPGEAVIAENGSVNTKQNLENAAAIMAERGWKTAAVTTSDYHLERALWLARDAGIEACGIPAASPQRFGSWLLARVREPISWVLYFFRKG